MMNELTREEIRKFCHVLGVHPTDAQLDYAVKKTADQEHCEHAWVESHGMECSDRRCAKCNKLESCFNYY